MTFLFSDKILNVSVRGKKVVFIENYEELIRKNQDLKLRFSTLFINKKAFSRELIKEKSS